MKEKQARKRWTGDEIVAAIKLNPVPEPGLRPFIQQAHRALAEESEY